MDPWLVEELTFAGQAWLYRGKKTHIPPLDLSKVVEGVDALILSQASSLPARQFFQFSRLCRRAFTHVGGVRFRIWLINKSWPYQHEEACDVPATCMEGLPYNCRCRWNMRIDRRAWGHMSWDAWFAMQTSITSFRCRCTSQ